MEPRKNSTSSRTDAVDIDCDSLHDSRKGWQILRQDILSLERQTYFRHRKEIVMHIQELVDSNSDNLERVMDIIYERARKEMYDYPIAGMLFEDMGSPMDGRVMNESILHNVQHFLQGSLDKLQTELIRINQLRKDDVGIVFLLCSLGRLDKVRGGDFKIFRGLLARIFKEFYVYVLAASYQESGYWNSDLVGALCSLVVLLHSEPDLVQTKSLGLIINILRKLLLLGRLDKLGMLHVLAVLESSKKRVPRIHITTVNYFSSRYAQLWESKSTPTLQGLETSESNLTLAEGETRSSCEKVAFDKLNSSQHSFEQEAESPPQCVKAVVELCESMKITDVRLAGGTDREMETEPKIMDFLAGDPRSNLVDNDHEVAPSTNDGRTMCETVSIPEVCLGRVVGLEGAILRKIEIETGAQLHVGEEEVIKPITTCMTAHRVVARALGVRSPLSDSRIQAEKEKLSQARERRKKTPMREICISGEPEEISSAKKIIDDILNNTSTITFPLFDFDFDYIAENVGDKLKTYESLLNVVIKLSQDEDGRMTMEVTGDAKSCQDAKTVVYEELGKLQVDMGQLVALPRAFHDFIKTENDVEKLANIVAEICETRVKWFKNYDGFSLFVHGYPTQYNKVLSLLTKLNIQLLCRVNDPPPGSNGCSGINIDQLSWNEQDYWHNLQEVFEGQTKSRSPSSSNLGYFTEDTEISEVSQEAVPTFLSYDREFLMACSKSPLCWTFPTSLQTILDGKDASVKSIILKKGSRRCSSQSLEKQSSRRHYSTS